MPFTFSHPAIILPVHSVFRRWTSLTALVAGSMAPDFEKFIRMSADDPYSHTWRSIFYFNLPVGLLLTFIFHVIVRNALIDNLPGFLNRRLSRFKKLSWVRYFRQNYVIVIISILLGATSHIFWDSFTHKGGRGITWVLSLINGTVAHNMDNSLFFFLQALSSLVGAVIVFSALLKLPPVPQELRRRSIFPYWFIVFAVIATVIVLKFWLGEPENRDHIFIYISAMLIGLIAAPFFLRKLS